MFRLFCPRPEVVPISDEDCIGISSFKPTWSLVVWVQHEGVAGLLQVHVGLVAPRVPPRRREERPHLGHDGAAVPARVLRRT